MNYYRRYVGDYLRDTARLSVLEHGAYSLLLDHYYAEELPIPLSMTEVYTMVRAMTSEDRAAVNKVLSRYFTKKSDGYHNARADHEIEVSRKARDNGAKGGRPVTGMETGSITGYGTGLITENGGGSGHPPTTNHQPPITIPQEKTLSPDAARRAKKVNGAHRIAFNDKTKRFEGITEEDELRWQEAYPAVPIPPEIAKAAAWIAENPANRKSNYGRFLVNWFSRSQDKAIRVKR